MTSTETKPTSPPPPRPFQFTLRTLLLLFVVLASSMAVFGGWGILVFGAAVVLAVCVRAFRSRWSLYYVVLGVLGVLCLGCIVGLLWPAVSSPRKAGPRAACANRMRQLALALQNYYATNGSFPPAYIVGKNGKPMHSWRVLILPYLDEKALFKEYDLAEPWDGPNNRKLLAKRPEVFACPSDPIAGKPDATMTSYLAVVGPNMAWAGEKPRRANEFSSLSHSIMLVEVANSEIEWTEPRDLSLNTLGVAKPNRLR